MHSASPSLESLVRMYRLHHLSASFLSFATVFTLVIAIPPLRLRHDCFALFAVPVKRKVIVFDDRMFAFHAFATSSLTASQTSQQSVCMTLAKTSNVLATSVLVFLTEIGIAEHTGLLVSC